ncbi:MAG: hypothetical protein IKP37_05875 [Paludibacteraceae bacterium]|nr:hypothetical protein [Paludibacteraceae bacterium]
MKVIRRITTGFLFIVLSVFHSPVKAQMVVTDPSMMAQQGFEHVESVGEMLTQTEMFLEELELNYKNWDENIKQLADKIQRGVRIAKKTLVLYKEIDNVYTKLKKFRNQLRRSDMLSANEKIILYKNACNACKKIMENDTKNEILDAAKEYSKITKDQHTKDQEDQICMLISIVRSVDYLLDKEIKEADKIINKKNNLIMQNNNLNHLFSVKY